MSEVKILEDQNTVLIELDGAANIANAGEILTLFANAHKQNKNIEINHQNVEEFDVTYLQLLFTLQRAATESGCAFRLGGTNPESFIALVKGSGLPLSFLASDGEGHAKPGENSNE